MTSVIGPTDKGTCISSLPCVLESNQTRCESNTIGCKWQAGHCERLLKTNLNTNDPCTGKRTRAACADVKRCSWSDTRNRCETRPTIIVSLPDDLGWYDVGFHNPRSRTPTLDALRSSGIALERHYVNRFCAPTRAMLLTGRHAWKTGLQVDSNLNPVAALRCAAAPNVQLIPALLKQHGGYETHAFGKWHLGHYKTAVTPTGRGFDTFLGFYAGGFGNYVGFNSTGQYKDTKCACSGSSPRTQPQATCAIYSNDKKICATAVNIVYETTSEVTFQKSMHIDDNYADLLFARRASQIILSTPLSVPLFLYMSWAATHNPGKAIL